jgi:FkbM family methyltransferase
MSAQFYVHSQHYADRLRTLDGERNFLAFLIERLKPGDCVFDIGAEIGLYTLFLAQAVKEDGQIIAFEPERSCYERLMENIRLNALKNVRTFRIALGNHTGDGRLLLGRIGAAPGLICAREKEARSQQKVGIVKGDEFIKKSGLQVPRAIKIDVEGYEYYVIEGLSKTLKHGECRMLCCEIHPTLLPPEIKTEMVIDLLKSLDFNPIEIYPRRDTFHAFCTKK